MGKWFLAVIAGTVLVFALLFFAVRTTNSTDLIDGIGCIPGHSNIAMHIHPVLTITVDGVPQEIPANIGLRDCMRYTHTHDDAHTGKLHIEAPTPRDITLGQFFSVWEHERGSTSLTGVTVANVTVDGEPYSGDYRDIVFEDGQQIVIEATSQ